jgi:hypothetical protein
LEKTRGEESKNWQRVVVLESGDVGSVVLSMVGRWWRLRRHVLLLQLVVRRPQFGEHLERCVGVDKLLQLQVDAEQRVQSIECVWTLINNPHHVGCVLRHRAEQSRPPCSLVEPQHDFKTPLVVSL